MSPTPPAVNRPATFATLALLCACFALSGVAALIYQTAWTRQFAIVFGTSELAVATVLAAYMGGLALGAVLAEKFLPRVTRPVLTYALLEVGIGVSAVFAVPLLLWLANLALVALFGGQALPPSSDHAGTSLFYLVSAFIALALPTTLMGATLPLLARYAIAEDAQIGRRIGLLYAVNTAGAVIGALSTAFALLPELGLTKTIWCGAGLNVIVFLFAAALGQRVSPRKAPVGYDLTSPAPASVRVRTARETFGARPGPAWVLPLMLLAGAVSFHQEVLWTRMLAHVVGSSIYAFGVMVASFLVGIALGGALGAAIARTRVRAVYALAGALLFSAAAAAVAYLELESLLPTTAGLMRNVADLGFVHVPMNALFAGLLLLPMTLAIGMTYPLAVRVLAHDTNDAAPASARVYAWNTVGAIVGSLAAGFVVIPALKYEGAIRAAVYASTALGVLALWTLVKTRLAASAIVSILAIVACAFFAPQPPLRLLVTSPLNVGTKDRVLYYDVGRSASVVMLASDGGLALRTNGLPEALMDGPGSIPHFSGEYWMSPLAVIARPAARDMLIVGFGGGAVVEGVPPSVHRIDVIELEPKVIEANRATAAYRRRDPLADTRVNWIENDARGALRLTEHRYDAIVSQPSHPWTAGASHLYTREFAQLARDHLTEDGVFVQWMNVLFLDEDLLRSMTATLLDVFPQVRLYRPDPATVVFLASAQPLDLEQRVAVSGEPIRRAPLHYSRVGINSVEDLLAALALDTEGARAMAQGAPLITDDDNRIATSNVFEQSRGMTGEACSRALAAYDPLQRSDSFVYRDLRDKISWPYLVRRSATFSLLDSSLADRTLRIANALAPGADAEYARSFAFRMRHDADRSNEYLRLAMDQYPDDQPLRLEFLRPHFSELANDAAAEDVAGIAKDLSPPGPLILATAHHAAKSEWKEIADSDRDLAEVPWTHAWYPEVTEIRANWRTRVTQQRERFGDEAVTMIDRLAIMNPSLSMYGLRARAGFSAKRPDIVTESVASYAKLALNLARAGFNPPEALRNDRVQLTRILDDTVKLPGADVARVAEVRAIIETFPQ
jgi:spermidine synthase